MPKFFRNIALLPLVAALCSLTALADMDIPVGKVTAYSGGCPGDPSGGGGKASNGDSVLVHNVERARAGTATTSAPSAAPVNSTFDHRNYAIAAVPQARSNVAGIFGCYFRDDYNYKGITFKAGDHYGASSNGLEKYDAAHACVSGLNSMTKPATVIVVEGSCGGTRVGDREPIARTRRSPPRKVASPSSGEGSSK